MICAYTTTALGAEAHASACAWRGHTYITPGITPLTHRLIHILALLQQLPHCLLITKLGGVMQGGHGALQIM
jgi:hypothetical protein